MEAYFDPKGDKFRGRSITTLPTVINKTCHLPAGDLKLKTKNDLDHLRSTARRQNTVEETVSKSARSSGGVLSQSTRM